MRIVPSLMLSVALLACADDGLPPAARGGPSATPGASALPGEEDDAGAEAGGDAGPTARCARLDLLFVVDNSVSMVEEQAALSARAGLILDLLEAAQAPVDYQLGVVHSAWSNPGVHGFVSPASEGALLQTGGMAQPWLEAELAAREAVLTDMLGLGGEGFDEDAHLQVARSALVDLAGTGVNGDFVRENAALGVVVVTDTDDQSLDGGAASRIDPLLEAFDELKGAREAWSVAVVAGGRDPRCSSDLLGEASYAQGLAEFTAAAGPSGAFFSLCSGDLRPALLDALTTILQRCARHAASAEP